MKVIVVENHISSYPNPVSFKAGDTLKLGEREKEYGGWVKVMVFSGNTGWAPVQYIESDEKGTKGIALKNYSAKELNTEKGQELDVELELNNWYLAKTQNGEVGWVPCHTVNIA